MGAIGNRLASSTALHGQYIQREFFTVLLSGHNRSPPFYMLGPEDFLPLNMVILTALCSRSVIYLTLWMAIALLRLPSIFSRLGIALVISCADLFSRSF
ncbi:hypothetical protein SISSUDRAFT_531333 [Sistotremastrum suecicum HHB10207 ss-3]|uniref:Uncharacterized protein n=1 Tax=Sistotremastrum suecicum HHB10207 ss-3 TaxID=1314776 RepID=A0A166F3Z0_9AGAM|nr:hypothetical protein SISSUDRAFT_531333 [Sistotremastrum suecicum HHB10207 ss-3]